MVCSNALNLETARLICIIVFVLFFLLSMCLAELNAALLHTSSEAGKNS